MKIGDLVISNMWFANRKKWNQKRIGLIIGKFNSAGDVGEFHEGVQFEIMWNDNNKQWYDKRDLTLNNSGHWIEVAASGNEWSWGRVC